MADFERFADWANEIAAHPRRRAGWGLALVVVGIAILGIWHQRIYNTFAGPTTLEARAAVELDGVPFRRLVTLVDGGKAIAYGQLGKAVGREVEIRAGSTRSAAAFTLLDVGDRRLLVRLPADSAKGENVEGVLRSIDDHQRNFPGIDWRTRVYLDCDKSGYGAWSLLIATLGIAAIGIGLDQRRRARRPADLRPLRRFT
jgi:hypothetical protein